MSHSTDCPAVREQGDHNWAAWTTVIRAQVPVLWRHCFECDREEFEFDAPEAVA